MVFNWVSGSKLTGPYKFLEQCHWVSNSCNIGSLIGPCFELGKGFLESIDSAARPVCTAVPLVISHVKLLLNESSC